MTDIELIEKIGGSVATAKLCGIKSPAVSVWKRNKRIPELRKIQIKSLKPELFDDVQVVQPAATSESN